MPTHCQTHWYCTDVTLEDSLCLDMMDKCFVRPIRVRPIVLESVHWLPHTLRSGRAQLTTFSTSVPLPSTAWVVGFPLTIVEVELRDIRIGSVNVDKGGRIQIVIVV